MALILNFGREWKGRVEINCFLYFFPSFADLLCLGGKNTIVQRPDSALIGREKNKPRLVQSEINTSRINEEGVRNMTLNSYQSAKIWAAHFRRFLSNCCIYVDNS